MSQHYFSQSPFADHDVQLIKYEVLGHAFTCATDSGVFSRDDLDEGSRILLDALPPLSGNILDLGCGWGAIGIALGKAYPNTQVVMAEVNERAAGLAKDNCARNGVTNAEVVLSDGFMALNDRYDAIITNPPIRAGKTLVYGWFESAKNALKPGGALYIVIRKQQGAPSAQTFLKSIYMHVEILDKSKGYWAIKAHVD